MWGTSIVSADDSYCRTLFAGMESMVSGLSFLALWAAGAPWPGSALRMSFG